MNSYRKLKSFNQVLLFCFLLILGLYYGAPFLIPFTFAVFSTTLLLPFATVLEKRLKFKRVLAAFATTFILFLVVGGFLFLLIWQFSIFSNDLLNQRENIFKFVQSFREQIVQVTGFTLEQQEQVIRERLFGFLQELQRYISSLLNNIISIIVSFLLMLIYVFLLLIYRDKFYEFFMSFATRMPNIELKAILDESKKVAKKYVWGRIQVMTLLGIMYAITFFFFDLKYSLLLIIFGALITIIPYLGPFISGILPILFMLIFGDSTSEIITFTIIIIIIQLIESYVLEPVIIGSEIKQSPLFIIVAIVLGGMLWGFAGLILFVPLFAVMKIIFDHIPSLKHIGKLIGYQN